MVELDKLGGLGAKWGRFKELFQPEAKKARSDVARHFKAKHPERWDDFIENAATSPSFLKELAASRSSDDKMVLHATSMAQLANANSVDQVESQRNPEQRYQIKKLPGGRLGCTCNDWRYKGSVRPGYACKHIRAYEGGKMKVGSFGDKTVAFFDELSKIRDADRIDAEGPQGQEYHDNDRPFSNLLTQDDEPSDYNPHPAQPIDEPEIILGGNG